MRMGFQEFGNVVCKDGPSVVGLRECPFGDDLGHFRRRAIETGTRGVALGTPVPVLSRK